MEYKEETKPHKSRQKLTREDFKKDVKEAVEEKMEPPKAKKPKKKVTKGKYSDWKVAELRRHVNEKKKALLVKAGFVDGKVPRSRDGLITLCRRLKRKRW